MYAWKCWRDSRAIFLIFLTFEIGFYGIALAVKAPRHPTSLPVGTWQILEAAQWMRFQRILLYAFALLSGAVPTGSFMLTRPLFRWRILWTTFSVTAAEFVVLFTLAAGSTAIHIARVPVSWNLSTTTLSLPFVIFLLALGYFLAALIIRSILVLVILLMPRRKALYPLLILVALWVYFFIATMQPDTVQHWSRWLPLVVPQILLRQGDTVLLQPGLSIDLLIRACLVLLFTFFAQKALEKREA